MMTSKLEILGTNLTSREQGQGPETVEAFPRGTAEEGERRNSRARGLRTVLPRGSKDSARSAKTLRSMFIETDQVIVRVTEWT